MKTNEEIQEEYKANPEKWIPLWRFPTLESPYQKRWTKVLDDVSCIRNADARAEYKLIHTRHKDVLEAWLADSSVYVEFYRKESDKWIEQVRDFIENYQEWLEYRLKEKKDENNRLSSDTDTTVDNSVDSDNIVSKMTIPIIEVDKEMDRGIDEYLSKQDGYRSELDLDTFTAHGFEAPSFDGEILKEVDGYYIGYVIENGEPVSVCWDKVGDDKHWAEYNLTPIKLEWYENPENFPCLVSSGCNFAYVATQSRIDEYLNYGWKLATKDELMSLYYKED